MNAQKKRQSWVANKLTVKKAFFALIKNSSSSSLAEKHASLKKFNKSISDWSAEILYVLFIDAITVYFLIWFFEKNCHEHTNFSITFYIYSRTFFYIPYVPKTRKPLFVWTSKLWHRRNHASGALNVMKVWFTLDTWKERPTNVKVEIMM